MTAVMDQISCVNSSTLVFDTDTAKWKYEFILIIRGMYLHLSLKNTKKEIDKKYIVNHICENNVVLFPQFSVYLLN